MATSRALEHWQGVAKTAPDGPPKAHADLMVKALKKGLGTKRTSPLEIWQQRVKDAKTEPAKKHAQRVLESLKAQAQQREERRRVRTARAAGRGARVRESAPVSTDGMDDLKASELVRLAKAAPDDAVLDHISAYENARERGPRKIVLDAIELRWEALHYWDNWSAQELVDQIEDADEEILAEVLAYETAREQESEGAGRSTVFEAIKKQQEQLQGASEAEG